MIQKKNLTPLILAGIFVLMLGLSYAAAGSSLRFSLSRLTTEEEVEFVSAQVPRVAQRLLALGL